MEHLRRGVVALGLHGWLDSKELSKASQWVLGFRGCWPQERRGVLETGLSRLDVYGVWGQGLGFKVVCSA